MILWQVDLLSVADQEQRWSLSLDTLLAVDSCAELDLDMERLIRCFSRKARNDSPIDQWQSVQEKQMDF